MGRTFCILAMVAFLGILVEKDAETKDKIFLSFALCVVASVILTIFG